MDFNNLTVAFSGHNIREFSILAIKSFLHFYPNMVNNIVYFDDLSTDGTKEELESMGIRVITWSSDLKNQFDKLMEENIFDTGIHSLIVRCDFIVKDILRQCKTRFIFVSDGDVLFLNGGFLENYIQNCTGVGSVVVETCKGATHNLRVNNKFYDSYVKLAKFENDTVRFKRIHLLHSLLDLYNLDINYHINNLFDTDYIKFLDGKLADVGSDILEYCNANSIDYYSIPQDYEFSNILHWGWVSSSCRDVYRDCTNSSKDFKGMILHIVRHHPKVMNLLELLNVRPIHLLRCIEYKARKSDYN